MTTQEEVHNARQSSELLARLTKFFLCRGTNHEAKSWGFSFVPGGAQRLREAERLICAAFGRRDGMTRALPAPKGAEGIVATAARLLPLAVEPFERERLLSLLQEHGQKPDGDASAEELLQSAEELLLVIDRMVRHRRGFWPRGFMRVAVAVIFGAALIAISAKGVAKVTAPRNLLSGAELSTCSDYLYWPVKEMLFHTERERSPFVTYRLEESTEIGRLLIRNTKNFPERAIPLAVEFSKDGKTFHTVAKREKPFRVWRPEFTPEKTGWIRLRVGRSSWLHLQTVEAYR